MSCTVTTGSGKIVTKEKEFEIYEEVVVEPTHPSESDNSDIDNEESEVEGE